MSIIHDALKKAQQELASSKPDGQQATAPEKSPWGDSFAATPHVEKLPSPPKNKLKAFLTNASIILIAIAITIASMEYIYQQLQANIPEVKNFAQKSISKLMKKMPAKAAKKPVLRPLAQLTINPSLTLGIHGIMSNGNSNLALINDQVYQEGDEIDGAKIVKINLDSVTFNINGSEKTIFVKS